MSAHLPSRHLPGRARAAALLVRVVNAASRRLGFGSGTVAGGRLGLLVEPALLARLAAGRQVVLVSGTNGKTTTTRLVAETLRSRYGEVVTNATGSNMPPGHVAALAGRAAGVPAVLEVDEGYLPRVAVATSPEVVVLLNLSRDQLDRSSEVRMVAGRWRQALADLGATVVANADDPLVVYGVGAARSVMWVAAGLGWRNDAVGCPACGGTIEFPAPTPCAGDGSPAGWRCRGCDVARPHPDLWLREPPGPSGPVVAEWADGRRQELALALPGRFNRANALMALAAADVAGVAPEHAARAMAAVTEVAGRFTTTVVGGVRVRLLLAKNPAGWSELLGLVEGGTAPVVVGINARTADGHDPSWLWDVPFERLRGRRVVATGERCLDLSVRLRYAEVGHEVDPAPLGALRRAAHVEGEVVEFIGNYTCFHDVLGARR
ncbi:MAG TPA: MurT ligase domain-containing protein [Acidimicrobiales bacterium]|nr:MurT ligase domain-containing protein [Acidimicrobiales bacterium]